MPTRYFISLYRNYDGIEAQLYGLDIQFGSLTQLPLSEFLVPTGNSDNDLKKWLQELEVQLYKFSHCVRSLRQYLAAVNLSLSELAQDWQASWRDLLEGAADPLTIRATRQFLSFQPEQDPVKLEIRILTNSESLKKVLRHFFKRTYLSEVIATELPTVVSNSIDLIANNKVIPSNNLLELLKAEAEASAQALAYYQLVGYYYKKFVKRSPNQEFVFG